MRSVLAIPVQEAGESQLGEAVRFRSGPGEEVGQRHPLIDFTKTDAEPSVVSSRGGANA